MSGVDLMSSMLIPLVVVRWLPTAVEQVVQFPTDGAGAESASSEASGCMGRMNRRLNLTFGEIEERGNGNGEILEYIQYSCSSHYGRYCGPKDLTLWYGGRHLTKAQSWGTQVVQSVKCCLGLGS